MDADAAVPLPARMAFPGISSRAYEHPADRSALTALRAVPGFDALLRTMAGVFSERRLRLLYLATAVRVGERQFRALHAIKQDAVRVLDLPDEPQRRQVARGASVVRGDAGILRRRVRSLAGRRGGRLARRQVRGGLAAWP